MNARIPVLLAAAAAFAACGYRAAKVEYDGAKQPAYVFPHGTHVDADVACVQCHGGIPKATKLEAGVRHVRIPDAPAKKAECKDCHDTDPKPKLPTRSREFRVRFSHADHLKRVQDCKTCHRQLTEPGDAVAKTPPMEVCTGCHNHQRDFAQARCMPCHVDLRGYKPETAFRHEGNWIAAHGSLARPSAETCVQCHDQTYCVSCHSSATAAARLENIFPERVDRAFIHRGDYVSRHMIEAAANPASCRRCHGTGFCESCHALQNVAPSATFAIAPRDPHPAGWVGPDGGLHKRAARRDISSCAACHDDPGATQTCLFCHKATVPNPINPHPPSFLSKHDHGDIAKNAMCRRCHT
jgi:predicted CXXCH cytochrome family protein